MRPIGVFDSGYGGLTVLSDLLKKFPDNDFIYLGDNARTPYGNRSFEVVYNYTLEAVKALFNMGSPLVILACNTASAKALRTIQQNNLPLIDPERRVLGVIRPSVEILGEYTKTRVVGIVGTVGTVASESYPLEIEKLFPDIRTVQEACSMWVPLVENNEYFSEGSHYFVKKNIEHLFTKAPDIDTLILGCTHYPLLLPIIKKYLPSHVQTLEQGPIVAESLADYLKRHPEMNKKCSRNGICHFYTTENPQKFNQTASLFLNSEVEARQLRVYD
ncbi:MAG: glutamate racemase [Cytophagaceae bacterium]|jgi:glutamate racemase|nr:glutamate racemase [Cytophagaceae bacterium]